MEENLVLNIFSIILYTSALILSLIIAAAVLYLKVVTTLYHGNLRVLLINVSFTHCFMLISGLSLNVFDIFGMKNGDWKGKGIFYDFQTLCVWASGFNMLCLFCERVIASIYDKKYEKMCAKLPLIGISLAAIDWGVAALFLLSEKIEITSNKILAIAAVSVAIIALLIFSFMPSLTYKRYTQAQTREFSLSQRYQMSENYRSAKLLTKVVWCFGGASILAAIFYILSYFLTPNRRLFLNLYDYAFISQTIFYPILVVYYETKVRDFICCNKVGRDFVAKSITGKNLVISNRIEQRETYFNGYKQAWA